MISATEPLGDVARAHRVRWVAARCGDRTMVRLDGVPDVVSELRRALDGDERGALVALDGLRESELVPDLADDLAEAVRRGWAVVIAVRGEADELPAAPADEPGTVAARLAGRIGGAVVIPQRLAQLSIIGAQPGPRTVTLDGVDPAPADVDAWLVVAGLPAGDGPEPIAVALGSLHRAYARWLDAANAALRRANVRMARERLGTHDAAAASTARRIATAESERDAARAELGQVRNEAMQYFQITQRKLNEPHYRIAEGIVRRAGRIPGARRVGNAVSRRMLPPG
jgi:hypothetical protein